MNSGVTARRGANKQYDLFSAFLPRKGDDVISVFGAACYPYNVVIHRFKEVGPKGTEQHYLTIKMTTSGTVHEFTMSEKSAREFKQVLAENLSAVFQERRSRSMEL